MASRCTGTNRGLTPVAGQEYKEVEARTDFEYEVVIEGADSVRLNQRVELPKGIKFEDGVLSGQFANEGIYYIDFIGEDADAKAIGGFKLIVRATTNGYEVTDDEGKDDGGKKKGCGGSIIAASSVMALIAGLGLAFIADKKRRTK